MTGTAGGCQGDQGVTQSRVCLRQGSYRLPDLTPDPAPTSVYLCLVPRRGALLIDPCMSNRNIRVQESALFAGVLEAALSITCARSNNPFVTELRRGCAEEPDDEREGEGDGAAEELIGRRVELEEPVALVSLEAPARVAPRRERPGREPGLREVAVRVEEDREALAEEVPKPVSGVEDEREGDEPGSPRALSREPAKHATRVHCLPGHRGPALPRGTRKCVPASFLDSS